MYKLTIINGTQTTETDASQGQLLSDLLRKTVADFAMPCAGNHTCGKCRVHVSGEANLPDETEKSMLSKEELNSGIRLACSCRILGNLTVTLSNKVESDILSWSKTPHFELTETGYGIAVDIGTTTVAMQLFDRTTGKLLAEKLASNAQRSYGADVISRIEACKTVGYDTLSKIILDQLDEMASECMLYANVKHIDESVVTGNSTMLHILEGLDPSSLAVSPFNVQSYFGNISCKTLANSPVYLPRCIGPYVGADIVCAILSSDMLNDGTQILADIGTNGEMALFNNGKLTCCSTAAGPAFEGAGLKHGMPSAPGAIRSVSQDNGKVKYETIQNQPAKGICGSGILDALAVMLENDDLDCSGYLEKDYRIGDSGINIIQQDVRQIQLAKAAICAGLITLLECEDIQIEKVSRFTIGGGFGSSMNLNSACAIGLFPDALRNKTEFIGNGALGGASMLLMNSKLRTISEQIAKSATEISLSTSARFMDNYIDCMSFMEF